QARLARTPFDVPVAAVILVGVLTLFWFVMRYTVFGRSMYAIGANPIAARLTGIRSRRLIFLGFVLSGLAVALVGLILVSEVAAATCLPGRRGRARARAQSRRRRRLAGDVFSAAPRRYRRRRAPRRGRDARARRRVGPPARARVRRERERARRLARVAERCGRA